MQYNWPLCSEVFTFWDKVKISKFLFTEKIWTYGKWVQKYEEKWEEFLGNNSYAIMVSSGSTANELIAMRRKYELEKSGEWEKKKKVVFPVNTWISSVSPWIKIGFEPVFVDISLSNLNVWSTDLKDVFKKDVNKEIGTVFYTYLLGYFGDLDTCKLLTELHGAKFMADACEATFSEYNQGGLSAHSKKNSILNYCTCSTSFFYSHFTVSGQEGGMIFCQNSEERDWYKMMRSHGLTRGMPDHYKNPNVSPEFDFAYLGTNYRSSNLAAFCALLDFDRSVEYARTDRSFIKQSFYENIDKEKYYWITQSGEYGLYNFVSPLALPIVAKTREQRVKAETFCKASGIQTRPIIGGCLLEHTAFKGYGNSSDFPNAMITHNNGFYIGINKNVTVKMAEKLALDLNNV